MRYAIEARRTNGARWPLLLTAVAALSLSPAALLAQGYPDKPVRYVVPFTAGGSPDIVGRLLADRLSRIWGQQVVVDNRAGAAGTLGTAYVAKAPPDGYTLVQCNIAASAISRSLYAKLPYDPLRDFAMVTRIGMTPNLLFVHNSMPARTLQDYIQYARAHPGKLSYGATQPGTSPQLSMELLKLTVKIDVLHVAYRGAAQAISDVIGGQVPSGISNAPALVSPVQAGRLRALAVTGARRLTQLPETPTMQESGLPGFEVTSWYGVCAPAGTPAALLDKLHADILSILHTPDVQQRLNELVVEVAPSSREEFEHFIRAEIARWAQVIKEAKIPPQ